MDEVRSDLKERLEDKPPPVSLGMRDDKLRAANGLVVEEQDVKVNNSGPPFPLARPSYFFLYHLELIKEVFGSKGSIYAHNAVDKPGLLLYTQRLCFIQGRF